MASECEGWCTYRSIFSRLLIHGGYSWIQLKASALAPLRTIVTRAHYIQRQTVPLWLQNSPLDRRIRPTDHGE